MSKLNVLVVDDKKAVTNLFDFTLGYRGHKIRVANSAKDAIDAVQREDFDIAFLDIIMPNQDGLEVLQDIKCISPGLPIVMMSGFSVDGRRSEARDLGAMACLKKPFDWAEIRKTIKTVLGKDI